MCWKSRCRSRSLWGGVGLCLNVENVGPQLAAAPQGRIQQCLLDGGGVSVGMGLRHENGPADGRLMEDEAVALQDPFRFVEEEVFLGVQVRLAQKLGDEPFLGGCGGVGRLQQPIL